MMIFLVLSVIMTSFYLSTINGTAQLEESVITAEKEVSELKKDNVVLKSAVKMESAKEETCSASLRNSERMSLVLTELLDVVARGFDDLDGLAAKDSKANVQMVNWFYSNAQFTQRDMPEAMKKYDDWLKHNGSAMDEYEAVQKSLENSLNHYEDLLKEIMKEKEEINK